eukprot:7637456-Lingulodinium_polyedra.AAC.1
MCQARAAQGPIPRWVWARARPCILFAPGERVLREDGGPSFVLRSDSVVLPVARIVDPAYEFVWRGP